MGSGDGTATGWQSHPPAVVGITVLFAVAATTIVLVVPGPPLGVPGPALHAAVETAASGIALAAAPPLYGRYRYSGLLGDLALMVAVLVLGLTNLAFSVLPTVAAIPAGDALDTWGALGGRVLAAAAFCVAALLPARRRGRPVGGWTVVTWTAVLVVGVGVFAAALSARLPAGVGLEAGARAVTPDTLVAHPPLTAGLAVVLGLYVVAAAGFWRRAFGEEGGLATWLAAAAVLAAGATVHYLLYPSLYASRYYTGDVLRIGFLVIVAAASARELVSIWLRFERSSAVDVRRRVARDLHDGLAQELAFISSTARSLGRSDRDPRVTQLAAASQRALDEARRAVVELTEPLDQPLDVAISEAVQDVAYRLQTDLVLDLGEDIRIAPTTREALVRIAREAVSNSCRHAGASEVTVTLRADGGLLLAVADDGTGFHVDAEVPSGSFGLTSMRERAAALGATLVVRSESGRGTTVEVRVP